MTISGKNYRFTGGITFNHLFDSWSKILFNNSDVLAIKFPL